MTEVNQPIGRPSAAFADSKAHYAVLDGLRGVAALIVICYHVFEGFATSPLTQTINHGYLAVDFFFILSGFVMGYAYDDRWGSMSLKGFFRRRLIRLHPMVVMGAVLGAITFALQGSERWDHSHVATSALMLSTLMAMFMVPSVPGAYSEVRGNGEMFPLNGPAWSLFFEYIGNIIYAVFIHRLSKRMLGVLMAVLCAALVGYSLLNTSGFYFLGVGWTTADWGFPGGLLRMLTSYTIGMFMARDFKPVRVRGMFWIGTLLLVLLLTLSYIGSEASWLNAMYDCLCIMVIFPAIVYMAASEKQLGARLERACKWLGDVSYPLYMVHYPFMYLFFAHVWDNKLSFAQAWPLALCVVVGCLGLAWLLLRYYDEPVRRWLTARAAKRSAQAQK